MPTVKELIEMLKNPPAEGLPDDLADQLETAYDEDVATYTTAATNSLAQVEGLQNQLTAAVTAKNVAQQHNAQLLKSIPAHGDNDDSGQSDNDNGDTDPFGSSVTIESQIEYL